MKAGDRLGDALERFFALRQHSDDTRFQSRLTTLQAWQIARLRRSHHDLLAQPTTEPGAEFLFSEVYGGRDLRPVAREVRRALPKALKLLPDRVMATSASALEAAIITQELDEQLTDLLGSELDRPPVMLTADLYAAAYRDQQQEAARERQLQLVSELGHHIDRYVRSRMIQTTFRLVRRPAHAAGFSSLYDFLDRGFGAMRPLPSVDTLLTTLATRERDIMQRLLSGHPAPFG
ncbi:hypothetical protein K8B33_09270 [Alcanivorax sp. JB21]|uniref:FFLEELY motif protein n=1 Tax=Alcanivorax limicola TaxID=2874102 RepID=UPI001CBE471A|nr:hypothetical protein [Alcanivorax limicola]MBZ2189286.1 hypothetical protein [Alcanivorax limicola]